MTEKEIHLQETMEDYVTVLNNVDIKIEANSRSYNVSVHVYEHATKEKIDAVVENAIYALKQTQGKIIAEVIAK